jgi:tRNA(Arg) A34 adenosine deaminase TadA
MKMLRPALLIVLITSFLGMLSLFLVTTCSFHTNSVTSDQLKILAFEADLVKDKDVPVAAGIWYRDSLIALGHNNVNEVGNAAGHAEINAISTAIARVGLAKFRSLDRSELVLISTYEPCPMCMGALVEYNLRNVLFLGEKPVLYKWKSEQWPLLRYLLLKRRYPSCLQEDLFEKRRQKPQSAAHQPITQTASVQAR